MAVCLIIAAGAIGCSSGGGGAGAQFCNDFATANCKKELECNPGGGITMDQCVAGFTKLCADPPSATQTPDVNCSGKDAVNQTARTMCLTQVAATSCADYNAGSSVAICAEVCSKAAPTGAGGGGGVGGVGGAGGAGGPPSTVMEFCTRTWSNGCTKAFDCTPVASRDALFTALFGANVTACNGMVSAVCPSAFTCAAYNSSFASSCLAAQAAQSCADFSSNVTPPTCNAACGQ